MPPGPGGDGIEGRAGRRSRHGRKPRRRTGDLRGDRERWQFARQDTVEAAWEIVDPVLGDAVPVHPYAQGSWGPKEADRLLPGRDTWHDPAPTAG
jgi:hypothetical protein